jgi:nucleoside-diphosphate-sugar epimerase
MKKIFITGITGFVGYNLVKNLPKDYKVYGLVRESITHENEEKINVLKKIGVNFVYGDINNPSTYENILNKCDLILHLAAFVSAEGNKELFRKINVEGTKNILERLTDNQKLIYFSSALALGEQHQTNINENSPLTTHFFDWYEWSKVEVERIILSDYSNKNIVIIRPIFIYGKDSRYGLITFMKSLYNRKNFIFLSNGENKYSFVHIDDVISAILFFIRKNNKGINDYILCEDESYTVKELMKMLSKELHTKPPLIYVPNTISKLFIKINNMIPLLSAIIKIPPKTLENSLLDKAYSNKKIKQKGFKFRHSIKSDIKPITQYYLKNDFLKL